MTPFPDSPFNFVTLGMGIFKRVFFLSMGILLVLLSCKKDAGIATFQGTLTDTSGAPHRLVIRFKPFANAIPVKPNDEFYPGVHHDKFTVTKFKYYVSNIRIKRDDGSVFIESESYHLIRHVDSLVTDSIVILNLPVGNYNNIEFLLGVDSLHNVSGAKSGDLDPINEMFWDWNQGYIFYKLEGDFLSDSVPDIAQFAIHIGGFEGPYSCLQTINVQVNPPVVAKRNGRTELVLKTDVSEIFKSPKIIGIDDYYYNLQFGPKIFKDLSVNYKDMFTVMAVENGM
jgi:hypothetical protein